MVVVRTEHRTGVHSADNLILILFSSLFFVIALLVKLCSIVVVVCL